MKPFEMIRKGGGLLTVGQDRNDPGGGLEHYQTLARAPCSQGENHAPSLRSGPLLKRGSSLAGKYNVQGWRRTWVRVGEEI